MPRRRVQYARCATSGTFETLRRARSVQMRQYIAGQIGVFTNPRLGRSRDLLFDRHSPEHDRAISTQIN